MLKKLNDIRNKKLSKSKKNISILNISLSSGGAEKVISLLLKELKNDFNVTLVLLYDIVHFPVPDEVDVVILSKVEGQRSSIYKFFDFIILTRKYIKLLKNKNIEI